MPRTSKPPLTLEPGHHDRDDVHAPAPDRDTELNGSTGTVTVKNIPARRFAALFGRGLRTVTNWDEARITHPEIRRSRRYYGADDIKAVLNLVGSRKGARPGSPIKYLGEDWDSDP